MTQITENASISFKNIANIEPSVLNDFQDYVLSHEETHQVLFENTFSNNLESIEISQEKSTRVEGEKLLVNAELPYKVITMAESFSWSNGMALLPTLFALTTKGFFDGLEDCTESDSLYVLAQKHCSAPYEKNMGTLWGALHLLGLQGWLVLSDKDENTRFRFTPEGASVYAFIQENSKEIKEIISGIQYLKNFHAHLRCHEILDDTLEYYQKRASDIAKRWEHLDFSKVELFSSHLKEQMLKILDGFILGPLVISLGFPSYKKENDRIVQTRESCLDDLVKKGSMDLKEFQGLYHLEFLKISFDILASTGYAMVDGGKWKLTEKGKHMSMVAPAMCGLLGSYFKTYEKIDGVLFADPDPHGIANDNHIDRVINVLASSKAGSSPGSKIICEDILKHYFDEVDLKEQPKGITDIGCGDGTALRTLASYIVNNTQRGKSLDKYPLYVFGADLNESPLQLTRQTLQDLSSISGVVTDVFQADISKPEEYDQALKNSSHNVTLKDLVPSFMFLIHNRKLTIDKAEANSILENAFSTCEQGNLERVIAEYFPDVSLSEKRSLEDVLTLFRTSFSDGSGMVRGYEVAADLVQFLKRWSEYSSYGLISLESHNPWSSTMEPSKDTASSKWKAVDKLPHPFNWGMHFVSQQYLVPFHEYQLCMALANFKPLNNKISGNLLPLDFPNIDRVDAFRFFSIGCYSPIESHEE